MSVDHSAKNYYEAAFLRINQKYYFRVYHFDDTNDRIVVIHESPATYNTVNQALSACGAWMDYNDVEAEPS